MSTLPLRAGQRSQICPLKIARRAATDSQKNLGGTPHAQDGPLRREHSSDIPQMTSKSVEIVPPFLRQGNGILSAAIQRPDFGDRLSSGRPFDQIFRHSDTPFPPFSPGRRFFRPTPGRVFVVDHRSGSGFSGTVPSARQPRPVGT